MNNDWPKKEQLHFAAQDGDLVRVKELVEKGYDINSVDEDMSFTPLHYAAQYEHLEVINYLLSVGANVNAHEEESIGETPLGNVSATCSYEVAEILIEAGANPTIPGWMQLTALHRAGERKKAEGQRVYNLLLATAKKSFHYKS
ncbi:MAG: ankyrin repeat domain-containing protein [Desulfuromonadales bacterium]|nr:ankyrin repeat domain-containing protein [Desulfuromonadales bacterium]